MDFKKDIIIPSWKIIALDSKVKKFYFLPGILGVIFLTVVLVYQTVYTYIKIAWKESEAFNLILIFFEKDYFWEVIVIALILFLLYIFLVPIFEWWLIKYIHKRDIEWYEKNISTSDVLWVWLFKFMLTLWFDQIINKFKFLSIINAYLFLLRLVWVDYIYSINWLFWIVFLFSIGINIIFAYSRFEIVLWNKAIYDAMKSSSKIAILNLKTTSKLYFLIFILNFRVIFNFLIILIFPFLISLAIWFFSSQIFLYLAVIILLILFIWILAFISYLSAVLEVFTTSLWYHAWKSWKIKLKDIEKSV